MKISMSKIKRIFIIILILLVIIEITIFIYQFKYLQKSITNTVTTGMDIPNKNKDISISERYMKIYLDSFQKEINGMSKETDVLNILDEGYISSIMDEDMETKQKYILNNLRTDNPLVLKGYKEYTSAMDGKKRLYLVANGNKITGYGNNIEGGDPIYSEYTEYITVIENKIGDIKIALDKYLYTRKAKDYTEDNIEFKNIKIHDYADKRVYDLTITNKNSFDIIIMGDDALGVNINNGNSSYLIPNLNSYQYPKVIHSSESIRYQFAADLKATENSLNMSFNQMNINGTIKPIYLKLIIEG